MSREEGDVIAEAVVRLLLAIRAKQRYEPVALFSAGYDELVKQGRLRG
jgi:hypothetical protein